MVEKTMNIRDFVRANLPQGCVVLATGALSPSIWDEDGDVVKWSLSHFEEVEKRDGVAAVNANDFFGDLWDCPVLDLRFVEMGATFDCAAMVAYEDDDGNGWVACLGDAVNKESLREV